MGKITLLSQFPMSDWNQMDQFLAVTHGENHVLRNRALFEWTFLRDKDSSDQANLIVAYEENKLISLLGYMPTEFRWGDELIKGAWMAHWMTLEGHRFGIGSLLMRKITEMFPIVAGQGASLMNREIVTRMKFRFLEKIPKVVFIFNPYKLRDLLNYGRDCKADTSFVKYEMATPVQDLTETNYRPKWDLYPSLRYGTHKDSAYLNFRYLNYPFLKYLVFKEGDGESPAVCVARVVRTTRGINVARILEFFYPEDEAGKKRGLSLMEKCLHYFHQNNCDYADFYCTSGAYLNALLEAGFHDDTEGELPARLDPIDMSIKYQNMEVYASPELRRKYPDGVDAFFVTRSDGDQDRPNESFNDYLKSEME